MVLKALIFDVDGTLAETEKEGHLPAFNWAFKHVGLNWQWNDELYHRLLRITGGKERIQYFMDHYDPVKTGLFVAESTESAIAKIHQLKNEHYIELLRQGHIELKTGVARFIREARKKEIRLAIATTTSFINVEYLLKSTFGAESLDWFEIIGAGDLVDVKKPSPDIYKWVLNKMQIAPHDALAIEDSRNGLLSSTGAGCRTLITPGAFESQDIFSDAWLVVDHLGEPQKPMSVLQGDWKGHPWINIEDLLAQWDSKTSLLLNSD